MREILQEWFKKKRERIFVAAKILAPQEGLENQTGFHFQQAIEKWLKVYLIKQDEETGKVKDFIMQKIER